jgi:integrase
VSAIDGHDIHGVIDEATRHAIPGVPVRNRARSDPRGRSVGRALSGFFGWLVKHRKVATNPALGVHVPPPPDARERTLSSDEIRWFWQACDAVGGPFGAMARVLLLCGGRREEARCLTRGEISADGTLWTIPGIRTKNGRPHVVPLSPLLRDVLASVPRIESSAGYVFTLDGRAPIAGIAKCKDRLDRAMRAAARKERGRDVEIAPWRLHDLRRSFVTGLAELGVRPDVIELCVNHVSGTRGGIAGVYNRSELLPERRAAIERWSAHVLGLVSGTPSNVVAMERKGA